MRREGIRFPVCPWRKPCCRPAPNLMPINVPRGDYLLLYLSSFLDASRFGHHQSVNGLTQTNFVRCCSICNCLLVFEVRAGNKTQRCERTFVHSHHSYLRSIFFFFFEVSNLKFCQLEVLKYSIWRSPFSVLRPTSTFRGIHSVPRNVILRPFRRGGDGKPLPCLFQPPETWKV